MLSCKAKGSGAPALAKHGKGALRKASIKMYQVHPVNIGVKHWCDHMHPQASELLRLREPARIQAKKKTTVPPGLGNGSTMNGSFSNFHARCLSLGGFR